ncbi:hypothetical protein [Nocardia yunnanensis]|nr:hypothetical protein [Nocardia yunnanensis]
MVKRFLLLFSAVAGVILLATGTAAAGPTDVHDDSHVLDVGKVTNAAAQLSDPVHIFTTEKFSDDHGKFDQEAQSHVSGASDVVLAINTKSKFLSIRTGANSHIRETGSAGTAFKNAFGNGDYTGATVAALGALKAAADQPAPTGAKAANPAPAPAAQPAHKSTGFGWLGLLCPIVVIGGIVAAAVAFFRRRRSNPPGPMSGPGGGFGGGYAPGGPGYGGPGYGAPGRGGMSPGAAAGLGAVGGAVGGGLLGYELGRMEGEHEERDRGGDYAGPPPGGGYDQTPQDWGGGGGDYDFGGGGSDFGGGDSGGGGGGDSGGGGGDF